MQAIQSLQASIEFLSSHLEEATSTRLRRVLAYWWFLVVGEESPFAWLAAEGVLPQDDLLRLLRQLFSMAEISDPELWHRLSRDVNLDILQELGDQAPHPNLNRLLQHGGGNMTGKFADLLYSLPPLLAPLQWSVQNGFLHLTADRAQLDLRFSVGGHRLARTVMNVGPTVEEFLERAGDRMLRSIETDQGAYHVRISVQTATPEMALRGVRQELNPKAKVRVAEVTVAGVIARIDFEKNRFSTGSPMTVQRLALEAGQLLLGLPEEDEGVLRDFLGGMAVAPPVIEEDRAQTLLDLIVEDDGRE